MAATNTDTRSSKSISFTQSQQLDKTAKDTKLGQVEADVLPSLNKQGFRMESTLKAAHIVGSVSTGLADFSIYNTETILISDFNNDGFYHRFSVSIDADTIYPTAYIFARLYLSYEGGPWNLYATSDNYHINGDSDLDVFVIETELADGFPPGYYDVRIELYDADFGDWLLSYGPYDDASLSALPLEDSYYDDPQPVIVSVPVEAGIVVAGHTGALSAWLLALPLSLLFVRRLPCGSHHL
jgi:hypothetical protein